ncbi:hypothetical protein FWH13_01385 [Candidatus Saccharibacteria bacterium]|nr:hypothetical protein [Candidatus Saccharibacteria bacterium]
MPLSSEKALSYFKDHLLNDYGQPVRPLITRQRTCHEELLFYNGDTVYYYATGPRNQSILNTLSTVAEAIKVFEADITTLISAGEKAAAAA